MVKYQSTTIHTCVWGQNSNKTCRFSSKMGTGLIKNGDVDVEIHLWFPSQASWTLIIKKYWSSDGIVPGYNTTHMCLGPEGQQNFLVFFLNWDWLGRKWWGWSRHLSMIPIPDLMKLSNKLILVLEYYSNGLQPHTHVFWTRTATKPVNFPSEWGLVW